jgi:transcriptional regulator with XRE-family HTH domain
LSADNRHTQTVKEVNMNEDTNPVRKARQDAGLSMERLCRIIDYDKGNLSRIENGKRELPASVAYRIEVALGLEPYTLIRGTVPLPASLRSPKIDIPGYLCRLIAVTASFRLRSPAPIVSPVQ